MKSLILAAVILQLVIIGIETVDEYKFGDIIEFPRLCGLYSHYAMYVGKGTNDDGWQDVGQGDNDIFHRSGGLWKPSFGKLAETRRKSTDGKYNYLDNDIPAEYRSPDKIKERIEQRKNRNEIYRPFKNNCEHLATEMRYGNAQSNQAGTGVECVFSTVKTVQDLFKSTAERSAENNNIDCPFSK